MTDQSTEPKNVGAESWDAVAAGWSRWLPIIEPAAQAANDRLVALAKLAPGYKVLDLASGVGDPAITAAQAVAPDGQVLASDISPAMVQCGSQRIAELGLTNIQYWELDAQTLDLAAQSFDAVLCRWGFMFLPDLEAALPRILNVLKPGAWLATAVWPAPELVPMIALCTAALRERFNLAPPKLGDRTPFELQDIEAFSKQLSQAGFTEVQNHPVTLTYRFDSDDQFVACRRDMSSFCRAIADLPPEEQAIAEVIMKDALDPYRQPDGTIVMESVTVCVAAQRPQ